MGSGFETQLCFRVILVSFSTLVHTVCNPHLPCARWWQSSSKKGVELLFLSDVSQVKLKTIG